VKLVNELNAKLNETTYYEGKDRAWSTVMQMKTRELAQYILQTKPKLDLTKPKAKLKRDDTEELREVIRNLSYTQWKDLGFSKGTLHYLKQNADSDKPFTVNSHVKERLRGLN
jgi:CRISPR-associated protein Cas1